MKDLKNQLYQKLNKTKNSATPSSTPEASTSLGHDLYEIDKLNSYKAHQNNYLFIKDRVGSIPYLISYKCMDGAYVYNEEDHPSLSYTSYNYLGLVNDPRIKEAAIQAINEIGLSCSSSRLIGGERSIHHALETAIAAHYKTEACIVWVSGHATNVSTISSLMGKKDLILHDEYIHNSSVVGTQLSGAKRFKFKHNDLNDLEEKLNRYRGDYQKVLILIEGHYSMDGDTPPLRGIVELKKRYQCLLMVDEAHSLGVLGETGHGIYEHAGVDPSEIDIWMGTLSKSLCSCGGYIAGPQPLIDFLKYNAPGFVFSVGLSPALAAASLKALEILHQEPERVQKLQQATQYFLQRAKEMKLNTAQAEGHAIVPIMIGDSILTLKLCKELADRYNILTQPIIAPAVPNGSARLRFFFNSHHTREQIDYTLEKLLELIKLQEEVPS